MKRLTFGNQQILVLIFLGMGVLLAHLLQDRRWINLAWVLSGGLYLLNPAYLRSVTDHKKAYSGPELPAS